MAKNKKLKDILIGGAVALALVMSGGALARAAAGDTKELSASAYSIGEVTEEGKIDNEAKTSIYTAKYDIKDLVSVEVAEDAKVDVFVHCYSNEGEWFTAVQVSEGESLDISALPAGGTFRIEITPTDDEDEKISFFEKAEYAKAVTVTLKR